MKKILMLFMLGIGTFNFAQDREITFAQLPEKGKNFIQTYFKSDKVRYVILDDDFAKITKWS